MANSLDEPVVIYWDMTTVPFSKEALAYLRKSLPKYCFCHDDYIPLAIYGDVAALPDSDKAVIFNDAVPKYFERPADDLEAISFDMTNWADCGPPPANFMVVTGDRDLIPTLQHLHNREFNILLAHPDYEDEKFSDLAAFASCVWKESALKSGGNPTVFPMCCQTGQRRRRRRRTRTNKNQTFQKFRCSGSFTYVSNSFTCIWS